METAGSSEVKISKLEEAVISKINAEFGGDLSILEDFTGIKEKLELKKKDIENALSVNDATSKISLAIQHVQEALVKIKQLSRQFDTLKKSVTTYKEKVNRVKIRTNDYMNKILDLEMASEYLKLVDRIDEISDMIEAGIYEKNEKKQEICFIMLKSVYSTFIGFDCPHLFSYMDKVMHYWHNILKDRFGYDYEELLRVIRWPFVGDHLDSFPSFEVLSRFQALTEYLLNVDIDDYVKKRMGNDKSLSLPVVLLIRPLRKRFMYHFMGPRQTNRIDKPEWYFTQILTWIRDHQDFIDKYVQPMFRKVLPPSEVAKVDFMRGLIELAVEKLHYELPELQYDDSLFSHCIDEALGFEKELRQSYGYPKEKPGVMSVITQAPIFVKWISMEKRYATEKLTKILASETAFETFLVKEVDEYRVTECAASFLALLSTITERYEMLPQPGHRLQFLELQLELVENFRNRLFHKLKGGNLDPLHSISPNILNSVNYVKTVLEELGGNTFFLHLYFYKTKLEGKEQCEGTLFDDSLKLFSAMRDDLLNQLIDHVFMDIKAKSMPYRKDKWHAMDSRKELVQPTITPTACPMFDVLIKRLHELQHVLALDLFQQVWNSLATKLDQYIYEEMAAICIFNDGGAFQFNYDITKNLFPLFGQYSTKPEAHFKLLKDSCFLLTMPIGLAFSLRDTLQCTDGEYDSGVVLAEVGIHTLKKDDVLTLISHRTDMN